MKLKVDMSSAESREFWDFVSEKREKVAAWPAWKRGFLEPVDDHAGPVSESEAPPTLSRPAPEEEMT